jgi:hypothetical protein
LRELARLSGYHISTLQADHLRYRRGEHRKQLRVLLLLRHEHLRPPVKVRERIGPALASPDFVLEAQPPAQPHRRVVVDRQF